MFRYAWKSFARQRTRSSLAISGIALSISLLIAVLSISNSVQQAITSALGAAGADMVVQRRVAACPFAKVKLPLYLGEIKAEVAAKLAAMEQVESVSGVLVLWAFHATSGGDHPTVVAGIDPTKKTIGPVRLSDREEGSQGDDKDCCAITEGRFLTRYDDKHVILTKEFATATGAAVGDLIPLGPRDKFQVVGIAELSGAARIAEAEAFIPLPTAQRMYGQGAVLDTIFVALKEARDEALVAGVVREWIGPETSITTSKNVDAGTSAVANVTRKSLLGLSLLVLVFALLLLVRNALAAVAERIAEVGLLRAIGWRRSEVSRLFVLEEFFAGLIGGLIGCVVGFGLALGYGLLADLKLPAALSSFPPCSTTPPRLELQLSTYPSPAVLLIGLAAALCIGAIAGLAASRRASRLDPAVALRRL